MKVAGASVFIGVLLSGFAGAEDGGGKSLEVLKGQFEELRADVFSAQERFEERYAGELEKLRAAAVAAGDLELTLAVTEEAKAFKGRTGEVAYSEHGDLARLQKIYADETGRLEAERAEKLKGLIAGYRKQLEELKVELTRAEKIDEALGVQAEIRRVEGMVAGGAHEGGRTGKGWDLSADLIGHWTFDKDGSDASGNGRDAKLVGAEIVEGRIGKGLRTGKGKYAEIADDTEFDLQHPFTLSVWVRSDDGSPQSEWPPIVGKGSDAWRLLLHHQNRTRPVFHSNMKVGRTHAEAPPGALENGRWYHVVVVSSGSSAVLYIDGVEKGRGDQEADVFPATNRRPIEIGALGDFPARHLNGMIDDLRIYKRALSADEVGVLASVE